MQVRDIELRGSWREPELFEIKKILAPLPRSFLEGNPWIQVIERQPVLLDGPPSAPGHSKYDPRTATIVVFDKGVYDGNRLNTEQFRRSVYHELAHAIIRQNPSLLEQWTRETRRDGFVDEYAKTSPEEDFADSFSEFFIFPGATKNAVPIKSAFLRRLMTKAAFE